MQYLAENPQLGGKTVKITMTVKSRNFPEIEAYQQDFQITFEALVLRFEPALATYHAVIANKTELWLYTLPALDASLTGRNVQVTVGIP